MNVVPTAAMNKLRKTYLEEEEKWEEMSFLLHKNTLKMLLFKERQTILATGRDVYFQITCVDADHILHHKQGKGGKKVPGCFDNLVNLDTQRVINVLNVCIFYRKNTEAHTHPEKFMCIFIVHLLNAPLTTRPHIFHHSAWNSGYLR